MRIVFTWIILGLCDAAISQTLPTILLFGHEDIGSFRWNGAVEQMIAPEVIRKNHIKAFVTWQYDLNGDTFPSSRHEYDSLGQCTKRLVYGINYLVKWKYDKTGNVVESIDSTSRDLRSDTRRAYVNYPDGRLKKRYSYSVAKKCSFCYYKSDSLIPLPCQDTCIYSEITLFYNDQMNIITCIEDLYNAAYCEQVKFVYQYDSQKRLIRKQEFDEICTYKYGHRGLLKKQETFPTSKKWREITRWKYDKRGNLLEQVLRSGDWYDREVFSYDKYGLPLTHEMIRGDRNKKVPFCKRYFRYEYY